MTHSRFCPFGGQFWIVAACTAAMLLLSHGLAEAAQRGKPIILLGDKDYPPVTFLKDGVARGEEVDLARELSRAMGREIRVELMEWHLAQQKVLSGEADGLLGMSITQERKRRYDFTTPIFTREFSLFVREDEVRIRGMGDLAGMTVGVTNGGLPQQIMAALPDVRTVLVGSYQDGFKRLAAGGIDAVAADQWVGAYTIEARGIRNIRIAGAAFAKMPAAVALKKGNNALLAEINRAIGELERGGVAARIREAWRPQEMVVVSRERVRKIATAAASFVILVFAFSMAIWVFLLKRQIRRRRLTDQALRESEERFRAVFEHAGIGIANVDLQRRPLQCNPMLQKMLGYSESEFLSMETLKNLTHPDDRALHDQLFGELRSGNCDSFQLENRYVTKSGEVVWGRVSATLVRDAEGGPLYSIGMVEDITERKRAVERLRESERNYRELIENADLIILRIDAAKRITFLNNFAQKFFGFTEEEVLGRSMFDTIVPKQETTGRDLEKALADMFVAPERYRFFENENVKKNGERAYVAWTDVTSRREGGAVEEMLCIGQDITEQRRLKEMMAQSEKMVALGGLAAGIAHELNSPLGSIVQNVQNIQRRISPELPANLEAAAELGIDLDQVRNYLSRRGILEMVDYISTAGRRAGEIIANMLTFSRTRSSRREAVRLNDLIDKVLEIAARDYDLKTCYGFHAIRIEREYDDLLPNIFLNPLEIEQVIFNILKNAAQALAPHTSGSPPRIAVRTQRRNGHAIMEIEDNGPGITPELQGKIFDPFFTTKEVGAGTGLGLSVSYAIIVNNHNGAIEVDATPGEGSRFIIWLPLRGS